MSLKSSISLASKVSGPTSAQSVRARAVSRSPRAADPTSDFRPQTSDSPFVLVNMAMTADGKIATANRTIATFGSKRDHEHLLELRATADAVMSGARTVNSGKINLGPGGEKFQRQRLKRGLAEFNLRIVVSGSGSIDPRAEIFKNRQPVSLAPSAGARAGVRILRTETSRIEFLNRSSRREQAHAVSDAARQSLATSAATGFRGKGSTLSPAQKLATAPIIILTTQRMSASSRRRLQDLGAEIKICGKDKINFRAALRWLKQEWGVTRLLCEGGGDLNDALFRAGLVDELHLTACPKIFGGRQAPTIAEGIGFEKLAAAARLQLKSARRVGDEMFLVYGRIG